MQPETIDHIQLTFNDRTDALQDLVDRLSTRVTPGIEPAPPFWMQAFASSHNATRCSLDRVIDASTIRPSFSNILSLASVRCQPSSEVEQPEGRTVQMDWIRRL